MNKQKPQLELGNQNGELSHPLMTVEPNKKKDPSSFLAKVSANEKPGTLCLLEPSNFLFLFIKVFSFPCCRGTCTWLPTVADPKLRFSVILNIPIFLLENIRQPICFRSTRINPVYLGSRHSKQFCNLKYCLYFACLNFIWYLFYMIISEMAHMTMIKINESCFSLALCSAYQMVNNNQSVSFSAQLHSDGD